MVQPSRPLHHLLKTLQLHASAGKVCGRCGLLYRRRCTRYDRHYRAFAAPGLPVRLYKCRSYRRQAHGFGRPSAAPAVWKPVQIARSAPAKQYASGHDKAHQAAALRRCRSARTQAFALAKPERLGRWRRRGAPHSRRTVGAGPAIVRHAPRRQGTFIYGLQH